MICPHCGKEFEGAESSWCPECQARVQEATQHIEALQHICADRPDLVHYLESLLKEALENPGGTPGAGHSTASEMTALSPNHVRWRAVVGKAHPHLERCRAWHAEENILPRAGDENALPPQPDWTDTDLKIHVTAVEGGDLTVNATWLYGPEAGGYRYDCQLVVSGWDLMIHLHWLTRSIYTLFFYEPEVTVVPYERHPSEDDDHTGAGDTIGELG